MPRGGARPGSGRKPGKKTGVILRREELLASVPDQFRGAGYDPLKKMMEIALKPVLDSEDNIRFSMHKELAKKYYPDIAAIKLSGDAANPVVIARAMTPEQRSARRNELLAKLNGHEAEAGIHATDG